MPVLWTCQEIVPKVGDFKNPNQVFCHEEELPRILIISFSKSGRSFFAVFQTSSRSIPKYWWIRRWRIAMISCQGTDGYAFLNSDDIPFVASPIIWIWQRTQIYRRSEPVNSSFARGSFSLMRRIASSISESRSRFDLIRGPLPAWQLSGSDP